MESLLGAVLGQNRIKFAILDELIPPYEKVTDVVDIYLDARSVFGIFFSDRYATEIATLPPRERMLVSAEIMNVIGHYRRYFQSRRKILTRFIVVNSFDISPRCRKIIPNYKESYEESRNPEGKFANSFDLVKSNLDVVSILCRYIPGTYFVDSKTLEPDCVPKLLQREDNISLVLSNNPNWIQYGVFKKTNLLTLKSDQSKLIRSNNVIFNFLGEKVYNSLQPDEVVKVKGKLVEWLIAISGSKKHSIKGWSGYGPMRAFKYFAEQEFPNQFHSIDEMKKYLVSTIDGKKITEEKVEEAINSFKVLSIRINAEEASIPEITSVKNQLVTNEDFDALQDANSEYFGMSPLRLDYIFQGIAKD